MDDRLIACFWLRTWFYPHAPVAGGFECISYPYPDERGGISIMLRETDDSTTLRAVKIPESAWRSRKAATV